MADNRTENAQYTYQATQISTATKEQLLLITYDIAIRSCRMAEAALNPDNKSQDYDLAHREIVRAQDVIRELMVTLNTEKGGEMALNLMRLYDYMYQQLVEANIKKDSHNVHTVLTMLEDLKSTWEEALMKLLKEYQEAHPEDEDLKAVKNMNAKDLSGVKEVQAVPDQTPRAAQAPEKAGGLNIAG
ncbi:MAG: flagellar export chaperone FliS [Synergistaceae bacterium]|nr:flagellar export chaperone FliS [Synergistaceae bacterium]